jgi:hypothetical protein
MSAPHRRQTEMAQLLAMAERISRLVAEGLVPVERMMQAPEWNDQFRAIMWEAVAVEALVRARRCGGRP